MGRLWPHEHRHSRPMLDLSCNVAGVQHICAQCCWCAVYMCMVCRPPRPGSVNRRGKMPAWVWRGVRSELFFFKMLFKLFHQQLWWYPVTLVSARKTGKHVYSYMIAAAHMHAADTRGTATQGQLHRPEATTSCAVACKAPRVLASRVQLVAMQSTTTQTD